MISQLEKLYMSPEQNKNQAAEPARVAPGTASDFVSISRLIQGIRGAADAMVRLVVGVSPVTSWSASSGATQHGVRASTLERVSELNHDSTGDHADASTRSILTPELTRAESLIREIPDYPLEGVLFRDIMPMLADHDALTATVDALVAPFAGEFDVVAGLEARGFLLASAAAYASGAGLMPIRKAGKLPLPAAQVEYALEYGVAEIEAHADFPRGTRVLLIDDVLATGGTLVAAKKLLDELGYAHAGTSVLFEIDDLGGRDALSDPRLHTVFSS